MYKNINPEELKQLSAIFRKYGADDPEAWAHSQLAEGIPQLAIFSFAKALWEGIVDENRLDWIDAEMNYSEKYPGRLGSQTGVIVKEMLSKGISREMITELVRVQQYHAIYNACTLIDGSYVPDVPITHWRLQQMDDNGHPVAIIQGLHEVILSLDPTGRELRPKQVSAE